MCEILLCIDGIFSHRFQRSDIVGKSLDLATFNFGPELGKFPL